MKKIITLCVGCLLLFIGPITVAQSKYFEKSFGWTDNRNGHIILEKENGNFMIAGPMTDLTGIWRGFTIEIDKWGNLVNLHEYLEMYNEVSIRDFIQTPWGYSMVGFVDIDSIAGAQQAYYLNIDEDGNYINSFSLGEDGMNESLRAHIEIPNDRYLLVGQNNLYTEAWEPYLAIIDDSNTIIWDSIYTAYSFNHNWFSDVLPVPNGGFYLFGTVNMTVALGDMLLLEIDEEGNVLRDKILDVSGKRDISARFYQTNDNGFLLTGRREVGFRDYGTVLKLDSLWNVEWEHYNHFFEGITNNAIIQEDNTFIVCGSFDEEVEGPNHRNGRIAKFTDDGNTLWTRSFGGDYNDYFYNMIPTSDGGFIMCGRTESFPPGQANVYVVKTNCLGYLTEPEASFSYFEGAYNAVDFVNTSQYVYEDASDGGHFMWDFGDGMVSNEVSPSHTYSVDGVYTVRLTAVVCNDTSVYEQVVAVGAVGIEALIPEQDLFVGGKVTAISPNPLQEQGHFSHELEDGEVLELKIYDLNGRIIVHQEAVGYGDTPVDSERLENGIYYYAFLIDGTIVYKDKLMIVK